MTSYYENPELKRSSCIILILAILFMVINFFILNRGYERVKKDYINSNAALLGKIVRIHPELKDEVVPIITKGSSQKDVEFGRGILSSYDYKDNLNIDLLPELKEDYSNLNKYIIFFMGCF
ncbi:hypothetical protein ACJDU8_18830 [Clostridium sp. WILCCON 0269]|uniref:Uncharacterized protein n=1 Tax=Candidatus Clostridium eludens TaxID=3381663 RepID=A0ABW8SR22_9CLOT